MDRLDAFDVEDIAGRRSRELVGAVRRADRDGERVDAGFGDEVGGLFGIGQQLRMIEHAFGAGAVFLAGGSGFERTEATELAFDRDADRVRHVDDAARDHHVVFVLAGVFMSSFSEPSIITLVKPERIDAWQTAGLAP